MEGNKSWLLNSIPNIENCVWAMHRPKNCPKAKYDQIRSEQGFCRKKLQRDPLFSINGSHLLFFFFRFFSSFSSILVNFQYQSHETQQTNIYYTSFHSQYLRIIPTFLFENYSRIHMSYTIHPTTLTLKQIMYLPYKFSFHSFSQLKNLIPKTTISS